MMRNFLLALAVIVGSACFLSPLPALATPITYIYDQTSSSVPGFTVTGSIISDSAIAPTIPLTNFNNPGPYDFGSLLSFDVMLQGYHYTLNDFTARNAFGFPAWTISSTFGYFFVDRFDGTDFVISGGLVSFNHDAPGTCGRTGECKANGNWVAVPVPEPFTLSLFGVGVAGAIAARRRKKIVLLRP